MKKILIALCLLCLVGCGKQENNKITIVTTIFPEYDFVRAIVGNNDNIEIKMLLAPGSETHTYEPTPKDIINIEKSDMFIYVGGESDEWVDEILKDIKPTTKIIKLMDVVKVVEEEELPGVEDEHDDHEEIEYDEHVWTSPKNAIKIINKIESELKTISSNDAKSFKENANKYIEEINKIDASIRDIVNNSKRKELIFGDRFPLLYFTLEYGLTYYAAFPGCSSDTEASASTVSFLVDKIKSNNIPVVLKLELSNGKLAETMAQETNIKVLEFNAAHNISKKDFESGQTYVDIMNKNIDVLKEALN